MSDPSCNAGMTGADLDALFDRADITYDLTNSSVNNNTATVSGSFSAAGTSYSRIHISLRKSGDWRVCGFRVT